MPKRGEVSKEKVLITPLQSVRGGEWVYIENSSRGNHGLFHLIWALQIMGGNGGGVHKSDKSLLEEKSFPKGVTSSGSI